MTSKYVTQGEREMVEAVVGAGMVCECDDLIEDVHSSGVHIARPASSGNGLSIYQLTEDSNHRPLMIHARANGNVTSRGIDFDRDDVMERGSRVATRDWVTAQLPQPPPAIASDWLVASDTVIGSVLFENVGEREFEYQPRDGVQVTFYPRTSSQNLPMPWSVIQQRIVGYGTTGPRIQVRCIADDGTKTPFVAVVINEAP